MSDAQAALPTADDRPVQRLVAAGVFVGLWLAAKLVIPLILAVSAETAVFSTLLSAGVAKVCLFAAVAVLGRRGFAWLAQSTGGVLGGEVGVLRHLMGLVPFTLAFVLGWFVATSPGGLIHVWDWIADLLLVVGFALLGAEFFEKVRALFRRGMVVNLRDPAALPPTWLGLQLRLAATILFLAGSAVALVVAVFAASPPAWLLAAPVLGLIGAAIAFGRDGMARLLHGTVPLGARPSRLRYRTGLALFVLPLVYAVSVPWLALPWPGFWTLLAAALAAGGLAILGGDFWDKLRALYVHEARASAPIG